MARAGGKSEALQCTNHILLCANPTLPMEPSTLPWPEWGRVTAELTAGERGHRENRAPAQGFRERWCLSNRLQVHQWYYLSLLFQLWHLCFKKNYPSKIFSCQISISRTTDTCYVPGIKRLEIVIWAIQHWPYCWPSEGEKLINNDYSSVLSAIFQVEQKSHRHSEEDW